MSNPLKLGKMQSISKPAKCVICGKENTETPFENYWICNDCYEKGSLKYKRLDIVWFLKYNKALDKLEVVCGKIIRLVYYRTFTYEIEYKNNRGTFVKINVHQDNIFKDRESCVEAGKKIGAVVSDAEINDYYLMQKQDRLYKQIISFLNSKEARFGNVSGIHVYLHDGYVNAEWKFAKRKVGDIRDDD